MPDTIDNLIYDLVAKVRRFHNQEIGQIMATTGLSRQDLLILACVHEKGRAEFNDVVEAVQFSHFPPESHDGIYQAIIRLGASQHLVARFPSSQGKDSSVIMLVEKGRAVAERA